MKSPQVNGFRWLVLEWQIERLGLFASKAVPTTIALHTKSTGTISVI